MTRQKLLALFLVALLPIIAVAGPMVTTNLSVTGALTGVTGIEFQGRTYTVDYRYGTFNQVYGNACAMGGICNGYPFHSFNPADTTAQDFTISVNNALNNAGSFSFLTQATNLTNPSGEFIYNTNYFFYYATNFSVPNVNIGEHSNPDFFPVNWEEVGVSSLTLPELGTVERTWMFVTDTGPATAVPEPSSIALMMTGVGALLLGRRRFRKASPETQEDA